MLMRALMVVLFAGRALAADGSSESIPGLGPTGPITKVHGDFQFTEGPACDRHGNLFFSDVPASRIYKVDRQGNLSTFREPSNNSNGLMFNAAGELVACEMQGRVVAISPDGKHLRPLAETYQGKRFNAPNDLVIDQAGGVYFTDPHFRAPEPLPQGVPAVYYVSADGKVTRLIDDLKAPNGVILSPDEKTLYVIPSMQAEMMTYPVESPGKLGTGRVFCSLKQPEGQSGKGGDGLTVDEQGNLYITSALGLQVFDPQGKALGIIALPEQPSNATFGGPDGKTIYSTARTSVYAVPMAVKGHPFAAGK
ncbi:MAG TPA: SMP-30/gluconolactonase/LRE family protein [Pirellulales bacterium]|jgi:gluconolactonase|nr:SMP-30/gluconolactonase/LRE family protein [Pirellulales bacterium]